VVYYSTKVIDGRCESYFHFVSYLANLLSFIWYIFFFYIMILFIFIFCYGRILVAIRRQARVMASHSGSSTAQAQSNQIQTNVIKTMILVSALYAIFWLPCNTYCLLATMQLVPNFTFFNNGDYTVIFFVGFLYNSVNPFIYATKFNPVRKILIKMIPCKKTAVKPTDGTETASAPATVTRTGQDRY